MRMGSRGFVLGVLTVVALAGCTAGPAKQDRPPDSNGTHLTGLAERDRAAVLAAVRSVDPCALLLNAVPRAVGDPTFSWPTECVVAGEQANTEVGISYYDHWPSELDVIGTERRIGSARGLVVETAPEACHVYLPVSPTAAFDVKFTDQTAKKSPCQQAEKVATAATAALGSPDGLTAKPFWDPCTAMATAFGASRERDPVTMLATCPDPTRNATLSFDAGTPGAAGSEPSGATAWAAETIAGTQVWFSEDTARAECYAQWAAGTIDRPYDGSAVLMAEVNSADCDKVRQTVEPLVGVLTLPPPAKEPQSPVLYPA
jgi:hypothetical protein